MITVSDQMLTFFELLKRAARSDATVLIRGESGTGKELVARALHRLGGRRDGPFRAVNCATLTGELLGSELFGHVRGAFTGAYRDRKGLLALADTGTVFLDEIAELPLDLQARLLRVLQDRSFVPVGGGDPISVDIRLVSATHRSLRAEVERRHFREDLMYRVRVATLFLPRLAERDGDIEALLWHFIDAMNQGGLRHITEVDDDALNALLSYPWPGNIRELQNNLENAYALGEGPRLVLQDLTPELQGVPIPNPNGETEYGERARLSEALNRARGHKGAAADLLGISRTTLWRKLREYRLG